MPMPDVTNDSAPTEVYDVFLSHCSMDKDQVEWLATELTKKNLRPFLDTWDLHPGRSWRKDMEDALAHSKTAVVFFGPHGLGPWHDVEIDILVDKATRDNDFRVTSILLPGATLDAVPMFLRRLGRLDFSHQWEDPSHVEELACFVEGKAYHTSLETLADEPWPYRGLERFEASDVEFFFGRDKEVRELAERLRDKPFVAVVGPSGCGKSSLVRAGLQKVAAHVNQHDLRTWPILTVLPGSKPLRAVVDAIRHRIDALGRARDPLDPVEWVEEQLARIEKDPAALRDLLVTHFGADPLPTVLFIDQFEEIFTQAAQPAAAPLRPVAGQDQQRKDTGNPQAGESPHDPVRTFVAALCECVLSGGPKLRVLLTLRSDFLDRCSAYGDFVPLLQDRMLLLGAPGNTGLREIIKLPAARRGAFLETGLVELILRDFHKQTGSLPLLEHTLMQLWMRRRGRWLSLEEYQASDGLSGALNRHADKVIADLPSDAHRNLARQILVFRLVTLGEGVADTRRRVTRASLYPKAAEQRPAVDAVLNHLSGKDARLIVLSQDGAGVDSTPPAPGSGDTGTHVEITHEALLSGWEKLRSWLHDARSRVRQHRRLSDAAREWEACVNRKEDHLLMGGRLEEAQALKKSGDIALNATESDFLDASVEAAKLRLKQENQRRQNLKYLAYGLAAALVVAVVVAWIAQSQWSLAKTKSGELEEANSSLTDEKTKTENALVKSEKNVGLATSLYLTQIAESRLKTDPISALSLVSMAIDKVQGSEVPAHLKQFPDGRTESLLQKILDEVPLKPITEGPGNAVIQRTPDDDRYIFVRQPSGRFLRVDLQAADPFANPVDLGNWPKEVWVNRSDPAGSWVCLSVRGSTPLSFVFVDNPLRRIELPVSGNAGDWWISQVSPDGKLAILTRNRRFGEDDSEARNRILLISSENHEVRTIDLASSSFLKDDQCTISADRRWIAAGDDDRVVVWRTDGEEPGKAQFFDAKSPGTYRSIFGLSPDSSWLAFTKDPAIHLVNLSTSPPSVQPIAVPKRHQADKPEEQSGGLFAQTIVFRDDSKMALIEEFVVKLVDGQWKLLGALSLDVDQLVFGEPKFLGNSSYLYLSRSGQLWHVENDRKKPVFEKCRVSPDGKWAFVYLPGDAAKVVTLETRPENNKVMWTGKVHGEHATGAYTDLKDPTNFVFSADSSLAYFTESPSVMVKLSLDQKEGTISSENYYFSQLPDSSANISYLRMSPEDNWLVGATQQDVFVYGAGKPGHVQGSLSLSRSKFANPKGFTFSPGEQTLIYNADGVVAAWHLDPYWLKQVHPFMELTTPFAREAKGDLNEISPWHDIVWGNEDVLRDESIPRFLDIVNCRRRDVYDPSISHRELPESMRIWLNLYIGTPDSGSWISPNGSRFVQVADSKVFVADSVAFSELPPQPPPKELRDFHARRLATPLWSSDGEWCLLADESAGRLDAVSLRYANPGLQTLDVWSPEARGHLQAMRDKREGAANLATVDVSLTQNRLAGLWGMDGGFVVSSCLLSTVDGNPVVSDLQCKFAASRGFMDATITRLGAGTLYLVLPDWSVLGLHGIRKLPANCRPPMAEGMKVERELVVANAATGYFIPAMEVEVPGNKVLESDFHGLWWDSVWHVDEVGKVSQVWKAATPIRSQEVVFSENGQSIWQILPTGEVERLSIRVDAPGLERKSVWKPSGWTRIRPWNDRLYMSPGEKWIALVHSLGIEIRIRSCNEPFDSPSEHVLLPVDYGESVNGSKAEIHFINDELLSINESIVRLGATRDEISCVRLGGLVSGASRDGRRVLVNRRSRVENSKEGVSVYSCDLSELLSTARWIVGRPPTAEELQLSSRTRR